MSVIHIVHGPMVYVRLSTATADYRTALEWAKDRGETQIWDDTEGRYLDVPRGLTWRELIAEILEKSEGHLDMPAYVFGDSDMLCISGVSPTDTDEKVGRSNPLSIDLEEN